MIKQMAIFAAALAIGAPAAAFAQDDDDFYDGRHQQDHREHGGLHDEADYAHARAHQRGFYGRGEHRGYHQALRDVHGEFHEEHPGTRHDGYRLPSRRSQYRSSYSTYSPYGYSPYGNSGYGYSPYGNSGYGNSGYGSGYSPYGYAPSGYGYSPYSGGSVTFRIGR